MKGSLKHLLKIGPYKAELAPKWNHDGDQGFMHKCMKFLVILKTLKTL